MNALRKCVGRQESFPANRWGAGRAAQDVFATVCLACTAIPRQSHRRMGEGLGKWQRDGTEVCVGAGRWVLGGLEGGGQKPGKDRIREISSRCVCQAPERTGGTHHPPPFDLSGPPARTQPTSPPHLAYLRWEIWAAWGPCKSCHSHVICNRGLAVCVCLGKKAPAGLFALCAVLFSRFTLLGSIPVLLVEA